MTLHGQSERGQMNDYEVYWISNRDPRELSLLHEVRAASGHSAITKVLEIEDDEGGLAECDLLAFPKWAAHRAHYAPPKEDLYVEG